MDCFSMNTMFGLFNLGGGEIILILALILILFGARKLPELAKGLGQGIKEFKKATREVTDEVSHAMDDTPPPPPPPSKQLPSNTFQSAESEQAHTVSQSSPGPKA
jgi:sec-independent protein translocase protein TatA